MENFGFYQKVLFILLMASSFDALALMACTDLSKKGVWDGLYDGICVHGPDDADRFQKYDLKYAVAKKMEAKYGGSCREIRYRSYITLLGCTKKRPSCLGEKICGTFYVINYPVSFTENKFYTSSPPPINTCASEADPCDPATGNVFLTETDIHDNGRGLSFTRHYQSNNMNEALGTIGVNWRHNHVSQIDASPDLNALHNFSSQRSSFYSTRQEACLQGGVSIKPMLYSGLASDAEIVYEDEQCMLSAGGTVVAEIPIYEARENEVLAPDRLERSILRPNGESYRFRYVNDQWESLGKRPVLLKQQGVEWVLTVAGNVIETYDENGKILKSVNAKGQTTTYAYGDGLLTQVTGPFGDALRFSYLDGKISSVSGPDGMVDYIYDHLGNLTQVTYPDGSSREYLYNDHYHIHHLTGIIDENDQLIASWEYDSQGKVIKNERGDGVEKYTFTYNSDGTTTVTDAASAVRTYRFKIINNASRFVEVTGDRCDSCGHGDDQQRNYDEQGHIISRTDWNGTTTTYVRDDTGLELSRTEAAGTPQARTITTEWHTDFRRPVRITEPERVTEYTYDSAGRLLNKTERALP